MSESNRTVEAGDLSKGVKVAGNPVLTVRSVKIRGRNVMVVYEIPERSWNGRFPKMVYRIDALVEVAA